MPRNGSGVYSLPVPPFTPNTVISSSAVNSDMSDIATAITGSLPRDGQAGMTGPFLAIDGTIGAPGIAFDAQPNTGFRRSASSEISATVGGIDALVISAAGVGLPFGINGALAITSTDAGTGSGPDVDLYRDSASPAAADDLASIIFSGKNSGAAKIRYAGIGAEIGDPTAGSEDGFLNFDTMRNGASVQWWMQSGTLRYQLLSLPPNPGEINCTGLLVNGGNLEMAAIPDPSIPVADKIRVYASKLSRAWPTFKTEDGFEPLIQPLVGAGWRKWVTSGGANGLATDGGASSPPAGTVFTGYTFAPTNFRTRNAYTTCGQPAAVGALGGTKVDGPNSGRWFRSATAGLGGFRAELMFALADNATGYQFFCGMASGTGDLAGNASALLDMFGVGFDAADASGSTFFIMSNNGAGAATRTATTGITRNTTNAFRLILDCPVGNASTLYYHFTNMNTGTVFSGTIITDLPTADTSLRWMLEQRSGAINGQARVDLYTISVDNPVN